MTILFPGVGWVEIGLVFAVCLILMVIFLTRKKTEEDRCPILSQSHHEDTQEDNVFTDQEHQSDQDEEE